jgi:hypothetical protein
MDVMPEWLGRPGHQEIEIQELVIAVTAKAMKGDREVHRGGRVSGRRSIPRCWWRSCATGS